MLKSDAYYHPQQPRNEDVEQEQDDEPEDRDKRVHEDVDDPVEGGRGAIMRTYLSLTKRSRPTSPTC